MCAPIAAAITTEASSLFLFWSGNLLLNQALMVAYPLLLQLEQQ